MSGPKCSQYELELIRRAQLRAQYEAQLRAQYEAERKRKEEEERKRREEEERRQEEERKRREEELRRLQEEERRRKEEELRRLEEERKRKKQEYEAWVDEFNADSEEMFQAYLEEFLQEKEQEIVAEAIDEALEEMGYDMVASMTPKVETPGFLGAQVYAFEEGVGIQVMEANGQVSMEIVGLGTNNRFPTDREKDYLELQMERFCNAYDVLEQKLAEKGIVKTTAIRRCPPDKQFARILNLASFEQKKEVETLQSIMKREQQEQKAEEQKAAQHKAVSPATKLQMKKDTGN